MSMGKSFVELDTRRAVETEFGRGLLGRMPKRLSGEYGEEVRNRMDMWKASVEAVQRITVEELATFQYWEALCARRVFRTEEHVLEYNGLLSEAAKVGVW